MNWAHFLFIHGPGESQFQVALIFTERIAMVLKTNNTTHSTHSSQGREKGGSFRAEEFSTQEGMLKGYQRGCA